MDNSCSCMSHGIQFGLGIGKFVAQGKYSEALCTFIGQLLGSDVTMRGCAKSETVFGLDAACHGIQIMVNFKHHLQAWYMNYSMLHRLQWVRLDANILETMPTGKKVPFGYMWAWPEYCG